MYKLILYIIIFLILLILVAFLLARRTELADHLKTPVRPLKLGGLVRTLTSKTPCVAPVANKSKANAKSILKYKLFTSIEFLTLYGKKSNNVVFIGSNSGTHLTMLRKLFPHKFYILKVSGEEKTPENLSDSYIINNIRDAPPNSLIISHLEPTKENLSMIKDIIENAEPTTFSIRFNPQNASTYFAGDLFIPPFLFNNDTQLISNKIVSAQYDVNGYKCKMGFFNRRIRPYNYDKQVANHIIAEFRQNFDHMWIEEKIHREIEKFLS